MDTTSIAQQRLAQQRLTHNHLSSAEEVVAWMGAVQAQDYAGAKWALGMRMQEGTDEAVEEAFNEGRILRTHVMRPTWHFVTPADIRWMLELTAPRVHALNAPYYRQFGLDEATMLRSNEVMAKALEGGRSLTRAELGTVLAQAGIATDVMRLGYLTHRAELDGIVCSGPRRGKQFTYALLDERAPHAKSLPREEALAELVRRYFTSHGPATLRDFAWWSGLTVADAKAGVAMVGSDLDYWDVDGQRYWFAASMPPVEFCHATFLLSTFDEFFVGYSNFDRSRKAGGDPLFESMIVMDGEVKGSWRRTLKKNLVEIEVAPFAPLQGNTEQAVYAAAHRFGRYLGLDVKVNVREY